MRLCSCCVGRPWPGVGGEETAVEGDGGPTKPLLNGPPPPADGLVAVTVTDSTAVDRASSSETAGGAATTENFRDQRTYDNVPYSVHGPRKWATDSRP